MSNFDEAWFAAAGLIIGMISLIVAIVIGVKLRTSRKKFEQMMGNTGVENLQEVMLDIQKRIRDLEDRQTDTEHMIRSMRERMSEMKSNVAMVRYNAFNDSGHGSDLSFSMAILDDARNGAVLTAIHGREETYMYGKPIVAGESTYSLSPEEKQAIEAAIDQLVKTNKR